MSIMKDQINACLQADTPALLWGPPGVGKTAVVEMLAEENGATLVTLIGSQLDPTDVGGILMPDLAAGRGRTLPPDWARELEAVKRAWLFLDELSTAPRAVQASLLRVVQGRHVAGINLRHVRIIAAANPTHLAADGWSLSAATANRWIHLPWVTERAWWADGMRDGFGKPQDPALASARALVARYVLATMTAKVGVEDVPPLLIVPSDSEAQGGAWPSPRSWDQGAKLLGALTGIPPTSDLAHAMLTGAVGRAQAVGFLTWLIEAKLPDPEAMLANPLEIALPTRLDQLSTSVESACSAACATHKQRPARVLAAWQLLGRVPKDVAVPPGGILCRARLAHKELQKDKLPALGLELNAVLEAASKGLKTP